MPFIIEDTDNQTDISEEKRKSYREYIKLNETLWSDLQDRALTLYLNKYDMIDARYNIPEFLKKENVDRTSVMKLMKFRKLYMNFEGRIAWLFEFPIAEDGLAWEFTSRTIQLISQPEII